MKLNKYIPLLATIGLLVVAVLLISTFQGIKGAQTDPVTPINHVPLESTLVLYGYEYLATAYENEIIYVITSASGTQVELTVAFTPSGGISAIARAEGLIVPAPVSATLSGKAIAVDESFITDYLGR